MFRGAWLFSVLLMGILSSGTDYCLVRFIRSDDRSGTNQSFSEIFEILIIQYNSLDTPNLAQQRIACKHKYVQPW